MEQPSPASTESPKTPTKPPRVSADLSGIDRPGPQSIEDLLPGPTFSPYTVAPRIKNPESLAEAKKREYPPALRDAGITGTAQVWILIDQEGVVRKTLINESSGQEALDEAALRVASVFQFTPPLNRDEPVPVWITMPITFTTR